MAVARRPVPAFRDWETAAGTEPGLQTV